MNYIIHTNLTVEDINTRLKDNVNDYKPGGNRDWTIIREYEGEVLPDSFSIRSSSAFTKRICPTTTGKISVNGSCSVINVTTRFDMAEKVGYIIYIVIITVFILLRPETISIAIFSSIAFTCIIIYYYEAISTRSFLKRILS